MFDDLRVIREALHSYHEAASAATITFTPLDPAAPSWTDLPCVATLALDPLQDNPLQIEALATVRSEVWGGTARPNDTYTAMITDWQGRTHDFTVLRVAPQGSIGGVERVELRKA